MPDVRIIRTPIGAAPLEIRQKWVGLSLPLAHPTTVKATVAGVLTHCPETGDGYLVNAEAAVKILSATSPSAASWWRENYLRKVPRGTNLLFDATCCREESALRMGQESACIAFHENRRSKGKAYLETDEIVFRGDFRVSLKLADLTGVKVNSGVLTLLTSSEMLALDLGSQADKWAAKIQNPKTLIDKLGVKSGQRVMIKTVTDADFLKQLGAVGCLEADHDLDWIFAAVDTEIDLACLADLRSRLSPAGALWLVSRKGRDTAIKDTDIIAAGRRAGLVDTKVASFSATHTALKFVIPTKDR